MTIDVLSGDDDDLGFSLPSPMSLFRRGRRGGGRRPGALPRGFAIPAPRPQLPQALAVQAGAVQAQPGLYMIGFPVFTFNLAAALNTITHTINPQVNFRAQALKVVVSRTGATAAASAPLLVAGSVGIKPIVLSADAVPFEIFATNATEVNILFPPTRPGMTYSLSLRALAAVTGADVMLVQVALLGTAYQ